MCRRGFEMLGRGLQVGPIKQVRLVDVGCLTTEHRCGEFG